MMRLMQYVQVRHGGDCGQDSNVGGDKNLPDSDHAFEVELISFPNKLAVGIEKKRENKLQQC